MPLVFRKIKKSKWYKNDAVPWLADDDLQADALADLITKGNELSVFFLDQADHEALNRLVTALASNRKTIDHLEYALFAEDVLSEIGIKVTSKEADTPDPLVNTWHRNLVELSARQLMYLAHAIRNRATKERVLEKRLRGMIIDALALDRVERAKMKLNAETIIELEMVVRERNRAH